MKVELSIKDDRELRNHIKDAIKGEVVSIARGEIRGIIADVFKDRFDNNVDSNAEQLLKSEIREMVRNELKGNGCGSTTYIKKVAREIIEQEIKEAWSNKYTKIVE